MSLTTIRKRRSIRKFQEKKVEPEKIELLIEAALRAPSSKGNRPWKFIVVTQQDLLEKLSRAKQSGSIFLKNAPLGIVVCADPEISDVWVEDCSIAAILIQLAAESLDLGSCWIQIRERMHNDEKTSNAYVSEILKIPENVCVETIVAVGYPVERKPPYLDEELSTKSVYHNIYGKRFNS